MDVQGLLQSIWPGRRRRQKPPNKNRDPVSPGFSEWSDKQDTYCKGALVKVEPPDILLPSCGPLVFLCNDGRMVTSIPYKFTRSLLRQQSTLLMATKLTRGRLALLKGQIYLTRLTFVPSHHARFPLTLSTFCLAKTSHGLSTSVVLCLECTALSADPGQNTNTRMRICTAWLQSMPRRRGSHPVVSARSAALAKARRGTT